MRTIPLVLIAAAVSACGSPAPPQQVTPTSSVSIQPVAAPAGLAAFPDFNQFGPGKIDEYSGKNSHGDPFITFKTDSGLSCFAYLYGTKALGDIECDSKNMPGFPATANGQDRQSKTRTESVLREPSNGPFQFWITTSKVDDSVKSLPTGQRLVVGDTGCAVSDTLLACIDGDRHGFVVSPTGSWAF